MHENINFNIVYSTSICLIVCNTLPRVLAQSVENIPRPPVPFLFSASLSVYLIPLQSQHMLLPMYVRHDTVVHLCSMAPSVLKLFTVSSSFSLHSLQIDYQREKGKSVGRIPLRRNVRHHPLIEILTVIHLYFKCFSNCNQFVSTGASPICIPTIIRQLGSK